MGERSVLHRWALLPPPTPSPVHVEALKALRPKLVAPFRPEDCERKALVINNLVCRVDTSSAFPFLPLFSSQMGVRRKRVKFPQAVVRFGNVNTDRWETLILYTSGVFVLCGMRSEMTATRALQTFRLELQQCNIPIGLTAVTLVNVVVNVTMPFHVDIFAANRSRQLSESSLTEDDFPGMTFKMRRVQVLAFGNGKCVLTGASDLLEMELVWALVQDALRPFAVEAPRTEGKQRKNASGAKNGKRLQKGLRSGATQRPRTGKQRTAGETKRTIEGGARKGRRTRAAPVQAEVITAADTRVAGRTRHVSFQLH